MNSAKETKIIYHIDDEETPYLVKVMKPPDEVTLVDFKNVLNRPNFKFFFKSMDDDFGIVKEEIIDDSAPLPCINGRVVSWLVTADGSVVDGGSQCGDVTNNGLINNMEMSETDSVSHRDGDKSMSRRSRRRPSAAAAGPATLGESGTRCRTLYDSSSLLSSELESTSFFDSDVSDNDDDDCSSRITSTTEGTSVSRVHRQQQRRRRRGRVGSHRHHHHHHHHRHLSSASASNCGATRLSRSASYSSLTDSTASLNVITVTLNMDAVSFLGISIVGQSNRRGDGGIYVGSIMKGGAVALDGRIEPGDMILQVNDINFEHMSNDAAVRILRDVVQKPGPVKLVVAKCWDPAPARGYLSLPRTEPVRPIDPGAWVAHTAACREFSVGVPSDYGSIVDHKEMLPMRGPSLTTLTSSGSSVATTIAAPSTRQVVPEAPLTLESGMLAVVHAMASPGSGLEVRDRMWLKITIPNAFIGSDVVDWIYANVSGFSERREARKYVAHMLRGGFIRHTVNKNSFSEQCYYVFGEVCADGVSVYNDASAANGTVSAAADLASTYCGTLPPPPSSSSLPPSASHINSVWSGFSAPNAPGSGSSGSTTSSQRHLFYNRPPTVNQQCHTLQQQNIGGAVCSSDSSDASTVQSAIQRCTVIGGGSLPPSVPVPAPPGPVHDYFVDVM